MKNMFVAERFLPDIVDEYGQHPVSTDVVHDTHLKHANF